jgi:phosphatidylglycerophosphate synthase
MDDLFGSVAGLPLHPLVVHGVVVLLPLMALLTVAVAVLGRWSRGAWPVVAGNVVVTVMALVAKESGERLQAALPVQSEAIERHAGLGDRLPLFALGVLAASLLVALLRSSARLRWVGVAVTAVAAAAAVTWTLLTGHSGAFAVWDGIEI